MSALGQKPTSEIIEQAGSDFCSTFRGSRAMSPEVKVEPACLVPRAVAYHEIIRDDKIER
jgi:hypothetical protein